MAADDTDQVENANEKDYRSLCVRIRAALHVFCRTLSKLGHFLVSFRRKKCPSGGRSEPFLVGISLLNRTQTGKKLGPQKDNSGADN